MSWLEPIDIYCERMDASFFAEPLNAISNAAFFIAAWCAYCLYRKSGCREKILLLPIILIALVGTGSTLFHTFANRITEMADVIPIVTFVLVALWMLLRRLLAFTLAQTLLALGIFVLLASQTGQVPGPFRLNGSIMYVPCLLMLLFIWAKLQLRAHPAAGAILRAAGIFVVSLTFRSVDMAVCDALPIGTHILWHLLNGVVLYLIAKSLLVAKAPNNI
ncbi:MAG: ceramidase domain-containing protein [Alphaproteobacteria bacterium]|nr:ceramidase domain-containing protein [Alphaproteobacteria bacterium]